MYRNYFSIGLSALAFIFLSILTQSCESTSGQNKMTVDEQIQRGKFLMTVGDCNVCHTPKLMTDKGPVPDMTRLLSGHPADSKLPELTSDQLGPDKWFLYNDNLSAWVGPWGISFASNLTPDKQTGLGMWTEEMFVKAFRTGKHMGEGRPILPPMPWENLALLEDQDLKAIFAYLQSIKPVKNLVPGPVPPNEIAAR